MNNADEILKRILLNMKYDPKMTLKEQSTGNKPKVTTANKPIDNPEGKDFKSTYMKPQDTNEVGTTEYDESTYISYLTVVPGKTLSFPITWRGLQPLKWHDKNTPYNEYSAKNIFGNSCLRLSGQDPDYKVGYDGQEDYYIDDNGTKCEPLAGSVLEYTNTKRDSTYDYMKTVDQSIKGEQSTKYYYSVKNKNAWISPSKELLNAIKTKVVFDETPRTKTRYNPGCKPLPFDVCLRWSWKSLYEFGGVDKGLTRFVYQIDKSSPKVYYSACVRRNKLPWLYEYAGFFDESKTTKGSYDEKLKQEIGSSCDKNSITKLPSVPSIEYGNTNVSSTDPEKMTQVANKYSSTQANYYRELSGNENLGDSSTQTVRQVNSVVLGGIRIKGK